MKVNNWRGTPDCSREHYVYESIMYSALELSKQHIVLGLSL